MSWIEWEALIVGSLLIVIRVVIFIRREIRWWRELKIEQVQQLVQLVKLAHGASEIRTMFDIRVSERMRDALCAPLTQEQLATIRAAVPGTYSTYVKCELLSSNFKGNVLCGVVKAAVRVSSRYSEKPLVCPEVQLKITVCGNGKPYVAHRWEVTSVERIV